MGIFSRKPKTYLGEKVLNVVKCAKCDKKMYIIEARGAEGGRCHACGKYLCSNCLRDLCMGSYKCCLRVATKGVQLLRYHEELPKGMSEEEAMKKIEEARRHLREKGIHV